MIHLLRSVIIALTIGAVAFVGVTMPAEAAAPPSTSLIAVSADRADVVSIRAIEAKGTKPPPKLRPTVAALDWHWWGVDHNFGPVGTNRIVYILNVGGGISGIVAAICAGSIVGIPCGVAYGVAAGLAAIGAAVIGWCGRNGNGFRFVKPYVGSPYCQSR